MKETKGEKILIFLGLLLLWLFAFHWIGHAIRASVIYDNRNFLFIALIAPLIPLIATIWALCTWRK